MDGLLRVGENDLTLVRRLIPTRTLILLEWETKSQLAPMMQLIRSVSATLYRTYPGCRYGFVSAVPNPAYLFKRLEVRVFIDLITHPRSKLSLKFDVEIMACQPQRPLNDRFCPRHILYRSRLSSRCPGTPPIECRTHTHLGPSFQLPLIFLIDRSASMLGKRIETVRDALVVMVRSFPGNGTLNLLGPSTLPYGKARVGFVIK